MPTRPVRVAVWSTGGIGSIAIRAVHRRAELEEAAAKGEASLYASGIEPGFAADQLPILLTTMSNTITSIRSSEIAMYDTYPVTFMMMDVMGFGKPLDYEPMMGLPGALL